MHLCTEPAGAHAGSTSRRGDSHVRTSLDFSRVRPWRSSPGGRVASGYQNCSYLFNTSETLAPVGVNTSHQCYSSCTGCQSASALFSTSVARWSGSRVPRRWLSPSVDCWTTFHLDYWGRDWPSTPWDNLKVSFIWWPKRLVTLLNL